MSHGLAEIFEPPAKVPHSDRRERTEKDEHDDESPKGVRQNPQGHQQPADEAKEQDAERLGEGIARQGHISKEQPG